MWKCCLITWLSLFKVNIGEDTWGEKCFSGEVVGVTAISKAKGEILCGTQVGSTIDCKTVIGDGY